ncbi:MAG: mercury transporter MerT [FCB group bacterium]|nr:mercury transporter MerT [FCB group bacterium]
METESGPVNTSRKGLVGAVLTAIVASICCLGPLVLIGLGVGGAWVSNLTAMEPLRPYLMVLTVAFLAYAFYGVYRKPKMKDCKPGSYCADPRSERINKILLWVVTVIVLGLLAVPHLTSMVFTGNIQPVVLNVDTREVVLDIAGMTCAACPVTIRKSLVNVEGVIEASVSYEEKKAFVRYDPTKISTRELIGAIRNAGYEATVR